MKQPWWLGGSLILWHPQMVSSISHHPNLTRKWSNRLLDHRHGHTKGLNLQKSKGRKKDQGFARDLANWMGHDDLAISILFYITLFIMILGSNLFHMLMMMGRSPFRYLLAAQTCSYTYLRSYLLIPFGDQHLYIFDVSSAELYIQPLQQTPSIGHAIGDDLKHYSII